MRRVVLLLLLSSLSISARANEITLINSFGSVSISSSGIVLQTSELRGFNGFDSGHNLGSVSFATGNLISGSIANGAVFSSSLSSFDVIGNGTHGVPKGVIFSGAFIGDIEWTMISQSGSSLVYLLSGEIEGQLYNGTEISGTTSQKIRTTNQGLSRGVGHDGFSHTMLGYSPLQTPEPESIDLFTTGLLALACIFGKSGRSLAANLTRLNPVRLMKAGESARSRRCDRSTLTSTSMALPGVRRLGLGHGV